MMVDPVCDESGCRVKNALVATCLIYYCEANITSTSTHQLTSLVMAQPALPDDILHVLCEELANQEHFDTLFNCACSSRTLAVPALTHLYRYVVYPSKLSLYKALLCGLTHMYSRSHHQAPVRGGGEDLYGLPPATKLLTIQRWSILWKSIIASSLDATLFPYCRYIKSLDFRDLGHLLDDDQFRVRVSKYASHHFR